MLRAARRLGERGSVAAGEDDGVHDGLDAPVRARSTSPRPSETERMRWSRYYLFTTREDAGDAEVVSHQLDGARRHDPQGRGRHLRLPAARLAQRSQKLENIVREEMDAAGAHRAAHAGDPAGRAVEGVRPLGAATARSCCASRTATSATSASARRTRRSITDLVRRDVRSYRQLPLNLYQIQTKFRDEIRPRFGLMRGREFIMKDAYSFHADAGEPGRDLRRDVRRLRAIFDACGLDFDRSRPTPAPSAARRRTSSRCWPRPARTRWSRCHALRLRRQRREGGGGRGHGRA